MTSTIGIYPGLRRMTLRAQYLLGNGMVGPRNTAEDVSAAGRALLLLPDRRRSLSSAEGLRFLPHLRRWSITVRTFRAVLHGVLVQVIGAARGVCSAVSQNIGLGSTSVKQQCDDTDFRSHRFLQSKPRRRSLRDRVKRRFA